MLKSIERKDVDGWGVGFFLRNRRAVVVKDADIRVGKEHINTAFEAVIRCVESEIIVAHFRLASRKHLYGPKYAHPFKDSFLRADWVFAHNGSSDAILSYRTSGRRIHESAEFDSPRVFEYIRDRMREYLSARETRSLYWAVKYAVRRLYEEYEGTYNFVLANSNVLFVNLDGKHPRNNALYVTFRKKEDPYEKAVIVTTVPRLTAEEWITIRPRSGRRGKLLMISEGEILYHGDI